MVFASVFAKAAKVPNDKLPTELIALVKKKPIACQLAAKRFLLLNLVGAARRKLKFPSIQNKSLKLSPIFFSIFCAFLLCLRLTGMQ